jgi:choline-sulfatase
LLFLPGRGAHPPYGSPDEFNTKWNVDAVKAVTVLRPPYGASKPAYHSKDKGVPHYRNLTGLDTDVFYRIHATYLGMVSYTDWIFGQLLAGIDAVPGLAARTAIFFSSDHGDFAGDYNMIEKWPGGADDVLTHVPFVARVPGGAAGAVINSPVALFDLPHTMCVLAGINVTGDGSGPNGINFGVDLSQQLLQGIEGDLHRFVYSEGGFKYKNELFPGGSDHVPDDPTGMYWPRAQEEMSGGGTGSPKWVMRRNLTYKLVYRSGGDSELYDFTTDPTELNNLWGAPEHAALQAELTAGLMEWLVETGDVTPVHTDHRGPPKYPYAASSCATTDSGHVGPYNSNSAVPQQVPGSTPAPNDLLSVNGVEGFY